MTKKIVCFVVLVVWCHGRKKMCQRKEREWGRRIAYWNWMNNVHKDVLNSLFLTHDLFANVATAFFGWCKNPFCFVEIVTTQKNCQDKHKFLLNRIHKFFVIFDSSSSSIFFYNNYMTSTASTKPTATRVPHVVTIKIIKKKWFEKNLFEQKKRKRTNRVCYTNVVSIVAQIRITQIYKKANILPFMNERIKRKIQTDKNMIAYLYRGKN